MWRRLASAGRCGFRSRLEATSLSFLGETANLSRAATAQRRHFTVMASEVVFIGGRSGVGKSSVGFEMHPALSAVGVRHSVINGDMLDMAYPAPWEHNLAERNLAAMGGNYRSLGYRGLIYMNSASVLPDETRKLVDAMGDAPQVASILLSCTDVTARQRPWPPRDRRRAGRAPES